MVECESTWEWEENGGCLCFNRYMVECECVTNSKDKENVAVLIDTWWNVNTEKKLSSLESIEF